MKKSLLSLIGAIIGFAVSQFFNLVKYMRRPRFEASHSGVLSTYTGNPPSEPGEITLGFFLLNKGRNPARNIRVFISDLRTASEPNSLLEDSPLELSELQRPIDILPSGESVLIKLGEVNSRDRTLMIPFANNVREETLWIVESHTRMQTEFSVKFHIFCDDANSAKIFVLKFSISRDELAMATLEGQEHY